MPDATPAVKATRFRVPGEGNSALISVVTVVSLVVLWFVSTNLGWIKPLFLPSPQAVFVQFWEYLTGTANDKPLWQHFSASLLRVMVAFWLVLGIASAVASLFWGPALGRLHGGHGMALVSAIAFVGSLPVLLHKQYENTYYFDTDCRFHHLENDSS